MLIIKMNAAQKAQMKRGRGAAGQRKVQRKVQRKRGEQLGLSARGAWGGYRAGAGRKRIARDDRGYVPHTPRPKVTGRTPVHVTLRCVEGLPSLRRRRTQRVIEQIFGEENRKGFRLVHYSIQGNHLHLIAEGDDTQALSRGIQRLASRIARTLNKRFGRKGRFFTERFDGKVLSTPKQVRNALRYVLLNHHKHAFTARTPSIVEGFDPFSSSAYFDGWRTPSPHHRPPERGDPVVPPRAWLLTKGWRKHGELEPRWF